jgi:hypothetical protein
MFTIQTAAFALQGHGEIMMPNGKRVVIDYRIVADQGQGECNLTLDGSSEVIDQLLHHEIAQIRITPKFELKFRYSGHERNGRFGLHPVPKTPS